MKREKVSFDIRVSFRFDALRLVNYYLKGVSCQTLMSELDLPSPSSFALY